MVAPQLLFRQRPDWGGGGGVRPRTDGQINETAGSLLKRSHVITVHQTDRALKLSPLSLWSRRERDKTQTDWLVKGFKCQNFHRPQLEWICRSARRTGSGGGGGGGRRGGRPPVYTQHNDRRPRDITADTPEINRLLDYELYFQLIWV